MELNSILDWAVLFSVLQLNIWQILHIKKSMTTWAIFDSMKEQIEIVRKGVLVAHARIDKVETDDADL